MNIIEELRWAPSKLVRIVTASAISPDSKSSTAMSLLRFCFSATRAPFFKILDLHIDFYLTGRRSV